MGPSDSTKSDFSAMSLPWEVVKSANIAWQTFSGKEALKSIYKYLCITYGFCLLAQKNSKLLK